MYRCTHTKNEKKFYIDDKNVIRITYCDICKKIRAKFIKPYNNTIVYKLTRRF